MSEHEFSIESLKSVISPNYSIFTDASCGGDSWDDAVAEETMSGAGIALANAGFHFEPCMKNPGAPNLRWMQRGNREILTYEPLVTHVSSSYIEKMAVKEGCGLEINFRFRDGVAVSSVVLELLKIGYKVLVQFQHKLFIMALDQDGQISVKEKKAPSIVERMARWENIRGQIESLKNELHNNSFFQELEALEKELSDEYRNRSFKRGDCYRCRGVNTRITESHRENGIYQFWSFCTDCGFSQSDGGSL